jgi:hypothetical protein
MGQELMTIKDITCGTQQVTLNLRELYPDKEEKERFKRRFACFFESHEHHRDIFQWSGDTLIYQTECIIPEKQNGKPSLLLLLGNPASHSVHSKMFFAFEGDDKREHRFWKALSDTCILSFPSDGKSARLDACERNKQRKDSLFDLSYESPFRIGLAVFYSMPSAASGKWSGVDGLSKLFRSEAFRKIGEREKTRVARLIQDFMPCGGAVIAFQKDAYLGVKSASSPDYILDEAKNGCLKGNCDCDSRIQLLGFPPTRLILAEKSLCLLRDFTASGGWEWAKKPLWDVPPEPTVHMWQDREKEQLYRRLKKLQPLPPYDYNEIQKGKGSR